MRTKSLSPVVKTLVATLASHIVQAAPVCYTGETALYTVVYTDQLFTSKIETDGINAVYDNCKVGDVIAIPSTLDGTIEEVCNFSKSIISLPNPGSDKNGIPTVILCVIEPRNDNGD